MYRKGIVHEINGATHQVRVTYPDRDDALSPWLDVLAGATHVDKEVGMPPVGELVACLLDEAGESGCVIGAIFSTVDATPTADLNVRRWQFGDGAVIEYNRASHVLRVDLPEGVGEVQIAGSSDPVALASKVQAELDAIRSALDSHTHPAGELTVPGAGPVTGASGATSSGYAPGEVAAARLKSA